MAANSRLLATLKSARAFVEVERDVTIESNSAINPETLHPTAGTLEDIAQPFVGKANALIASLTAEIERVETGFGAVDFPYTRTFNAIADAVTVRWPSEKGSIGISVEAFQRSFNGNTRPDGDASALRDIAAERQRQIDAEGWTPQHDDGHRDGNLAVAAGCYALLGSGKWDKRAIREIWPWGWGWLKSKRTDRRRDLVKAGALIVAEIERLDRATLSQGEA